MDHVHYWNKNSMPGMISQSFHENYLTMKSMAKLACIKEYPVSRRFSHLFRLFYQNTLETDEELKPNEFLAFIRNCMYIKAISNGKEKTVCRDSPAKPTVTEL